MSTPGFVYRNLSQTLVYWGNPQNDGYNNYSFDDPVEIVGRLEEKDEMVVTNDGAERLSQARAYLNQSVDNGGYLYLGALTDSSVDSVSDPHTTQGAMRVLTTKKVPILGSSTEFLYIAHLNMQ